MKVVPEIIFVTEESQWNTDDGIAIIALFYDAYLGKDELTISKRDVFRLTVEIWMSMRYPQILSTWKG